MNAQLINTWVWELKVTSLSKRGMCYFMLSFCNLLQQQKNTTTTTLPTASRFVMECYTNGTMH